MPDLRSELVKVIPMMQPQSLDSLSFDDDDTPIQPKLELNNATLLAFVAAHPACTFREVSKHFRDDAGQSAARLKQLTDRGFLERVKIDEVYHYKRTALEYRQVTREERIKLMNETRLRNRQARAAAAPAPAPKKLKPKTKTKAKRAPKHIVPLAVQKAAIIAPTPTDADTIIDNLGLKQAKALYEELKKYFG